MLLFVFAGSFAWRGMADPALLSKLSKVTKTMFMPFLSFNAIAGGITPEFIKDNWQLIVFGMFVQVPGFICGQLLAWLVNVPAHVRPWFVLGITLPNMVALPLVLVEAICREGSATQAEISTCVDGGVTRLVTVVLTQTPMTWTVFYASANGVPGSAG